jgi:hypothetical protein
MDFDRGGMTKNRITIDEIITLCPCREYSPAHIKVLAGNAKDFKQNTACGVECEAQVAIIKKL